MIKKVFFILCLLFFYSSAAFSMGCSFSKSGDFNEKKYLLSAMNDVEDLLSVIDSQKQLLFSLSLDEGADRGFKVSVEKNEKEMFVSVSAQNQLMLVYGLYSFLQDIGGFRFVHPKQTIVPAELSLKSISYEKYPYFENRGFHLHTLHPTELTEYLHAPWKKDALKNIKDYMRWLVRNGQNVFQFYLLRTVDLKKWEPYMAEIAETAHNMGLKIGVMTSFSMLQQNAFQFVTLMEGGYKKQIKEKLSRLFKIKWDFISIDTTMGEFLPDLRLSHAEAIRYLIKEIEKDYKTKVFLSTHVIKDKKRILHDGTPVVMTGDTGVLIHTVMCFALKDDYAPAYENENFGFMYDKLIGYGREREVWYWPESSYWVSFDNSVPVLLLPYLKARWDDIVLLKNKGVNGHLTFTSGWEWGYWLIDWAVTRWSWGQNGEVSKMGNASEEIFNFLFSNKNISILFRKVFDLQNEFLIDKRLLVYLPAAAPFSELPAPFNRGFQPRPPFTMKKILQMNKVEAISAFNNSKLNELKNFADETAKICSELDAEITELDNDQLSNLAAELNNALKITALRSKFKYYLLKASAYKASDDVLKYNILLENAADIYQKALVLVSQQENYYRYDKYIYDRFESFTSYDFGYLYPVSELFFWKREMEQLKSEQFNAFFMNLWNFEKIVGLSSLFK